MNVITATKLCKSYGARQALNQLSFSLQPGQILGIIGPNGSGKSTALRSLMGLVTIDSGELAVLGLDPYAQRAQLMQQSRFIADVGILPRWMRIDDLLKHLTAVDEAFDRNRALEALEGTQIHGRQRVRSLSKGMAVQLHLAIAMAADVPLLVLDEPTLGLDILHRQRFYDQLLGTYFDAQRAIVITTHEIHEVEHVLTHLLLLQKGSSRLQCTMDEYATRFTRVSAAAQSHTELASLGPLHMEQTLDGTVAVFDGVDRSQLERLGSVTTPTLSELFLAVMAEPAP